MAMTTQSEIDITNPRPNATMLLGSQTHHHLRSGFAAEVQVQSLLLYFALIAEIEGHLEVAASLRGLADVHALHAHGHLDLLRRAAEPLTGLPMGLTAQNLICAAAAARQAAEETYPDMITTAESEGFFDIADWLRTVARANESHADRLCRVGAGYETP
jgi:rubrerythrin